MPTKKAPGTTAGARPRHQTGKGWEKGLEALAQRVTRWASGSQGFLFAVGTVALWLATGPFVRYSETWQLIINTGTTIVTFVMVFLIQRSQSKDALAIQLKLDEIIAALAGASNQLVAVEELSEAELQDLNRRYRALKERAGRLRDAGEVLSVDAPAPRAADRPRPGDKKRAAGPAAPR
jgi:low affinity Fe/Cu permease